MKLGNFIEGIEVLRQYYKDPMGYHLGGEHDVIYLYPTDRPLSDEDVEKMRGFGWTQEQTPEQYDPAESWAAYT